MQNGSFIHVKRGTKDKIMSEKVTESKGTWIGYNSKICVFVKQGCHQCILTAIRSVSKTKREGLLKPP